MHSRWSWNHATGANALPVRNKRKEKAELNLKDLIPHFVRVKSEDGTPFRIHKALAMHYSGWFRDRLGPKSVARADDKMILGSVDNRTLVAFLEWLYKQTKWQPPSSSESGYARFTSPLDDEGLTRAYVFTIRYSVPAMKRNIIERAVELFKHKGPGYSTITMAYEELPPSSPFIRLLVDAFCAHHQPYTRGSSATATSTANTNLSPFDSGIFIDYGTDTTIIDAMDVDDDHANPPDSRSDTGSDFRGNDDMKLYGLPSIFIRRVIKKMQKLEAGNVKHIVLHRFDYEEDPNLT